MTLFGVGEAKGRKERDMRARGGGEKYLSGFWNKAAKNWQELITNTKSVKGNVGLTFILCPDWCYARKYFLPAVLLAQQMLWKLTSVFKLSFQERESTWVVFWLDFLERFFCRGKRRFFFNLKQQSVKMRQFCKTEHCHWLQMKWKLQHRKQDVVPPPLPWCEALRFSRPARSDQG